MMLCWKLKRFFIFKHIFFLDTRHRKSSNKKLNKGLKNINESLFTSCKCSLNFIFLTYLKFEKIKFKFYLSLWRHATS